MSDPRVREIISTLADVENELLKQKLSNAETDSFEDYEVDLDDSLDDYDVDDIDDIDYDYEYDED